MSGNRSNIKKKKSAPASDEKAFYKILAMFFAAAVIEVLFVAVYRKYYSGNGNGGLNTAMTVLAGVCAALFVCAGAACVMFAKTKKRLSNQLAGCAGVLLFLAVSALLLARHGLTAAKLLCVLCPVLLLLYIVFIIYQREMFVSALLCAVCLVALWGIKRFEGGTYAVVLLCVTLAFAAAAAVLALLARRNEGRAGKLKIYELPESGIIVPVTAALAAAATAAAFFAGAKVGDPAVFLVSAYLFVLAVYYTVKLM